MNRPGPALSLGLFAALALAACAVPRAVLIPAPPSEVRKEASAPATAAAERVAPPAPREGRPREGADPEGRDAASGRAPAPAQAAVQGPLMPPRLSEYVEAYAKTTAAIASGAARDAAPYWRALEDSKWGTDAVFNQGVLFQLAGDLDEAAAQYRRVADRSPAFAPALANLLGLSLLQGEKERTRSLAARVAPPGSPLPPETIPELVINTAAALMEMGRGDDAALLLRSLRDRRKATPALSWNLAVLAFRTGDTATARSLAGTVSPGVQNLYPVVASRFAWATEGEKVPSLGPAPPGMAGMATLSANLKAYEEFRSGIVEAAEKSLASAAGGESTPAEILTNMGILQAEQGHWSEARKSLERAVRENPALPPAWLNLGIFREVYEGNLAAARDCYDNYVKLNGLRKEEVRKWSDRLGQSASPQR